MPEEYTRSLVKVRSVQANADNVKVFVTINKKSIQPMPALAPGSCFLHNGT